MNQTEIVITTFRMKKTLLISARPSLPSPKKLKALFLYSLDMGNRQRSGAGIY